MGLNQILLFCHDQLNVMLMLLLNLKKGHPFPARRLLLLHQVIDEGMMLIGLGWLLIAVIFAVGRAVFIDRH